MSLSGARKLWMSVIAITIIYGNVAVTLNPQKLGLPMTRLLPRPFAVHDAFLLTGMFTSFAHENVDFVIGGRTHDANGHPRWIVLDLDEMIPGRTGIKFTQLLVARHWDMLGEQAQREQWRQMARKIRLRHNRLHPERPIDAVRIGAQAWPLSPDGYRAAKPAKPTYRDWFNEARER